MNRLPPLSALHAFALVVEDGSLAAAAARLNVTQPAVSRRVRDLEAALGVALLRRGANAVVPTEAGARYAAALREAFGAIRQATAALGAGPAAPLRVRAYTTWTLRWLIPRLPRFRLLHPTIEIEVVTSTAPAVDFAREGLDAAVRSGAGPPQRGALRLQPITLAPYATKAALRREGPSGLTRLGSRVRPGDWSTWLKAQREAAPPSPQPLLFESTSLAIQAALEGLGAVICPPDYVAEEVRRRRLTRLPGQDAATGEHYWLLLPPGRQRPAAASFRHWLVQEASAAAPPACPAVRRRA
jgi:LysR family glycine cleavage system transcriptional activator